MQYLKHCLEELQQVILDLPEEHQLEPLQKFEAVTVAFMSLLESEAKSEIEAAIGYILSARCEFHD